jgi:transcriptional regulator with XRE-family HTH domain
MDGDWLRLGRAVQNARNSKGLSQARLGELADAKRTVIQTIERGHQFKRITVTLRNIERTLDWGTGSIESVLAGGDPLPPGEPGGREAAVRLRQGIESVLPLRVARSLSEGVTLDTTIVPLSPNAEMVIVVKGKPDATPEQLRAALTAWEKRVGDLHRMGDLAERPEPQP